MRGCNITLQYAELYRQTVALFKEAGQEDVQRQVNELFQAVFALRPHDLITRGTEPAAAEQTLKLVNLVARRLSGEPLQYLVGNWDFYGLTLDVGPGVLIPREDTAVLVDAALAKITHLPAPTVIDLCSGSGAVALAVAATHRQAHVTAVEYSERAFAYLRKNIEKTALQNVTALKADIFDRPELPPADIIVCNPPYLTEEEMGEIAPEVTHEPADALCGGESGLEFYDFIISEYHYCLKEGGWLFFEVGYRQAEQVATLFEREGYRDITLAKDTADILRVVGARRHG